LGRKGLKPPPPELYVVELIERGRGLPQERKIA